MMSSYLNQSYLDLELPAYPMRWVVSVSSGASSAVAVERVLQRHGHENVDLVFADTLHEHADNYRFLAEIEARWGKQIIRLADGRTPEQVWDDRGLIPNDQIAPCTYELKLKLIINYVKQLRAQGYMVVMCVGFSLKDTRKKSPLAKQYPQWFVERYPGRLLATTVNWAQSGLAITEFPCLWKPLDFDVLETVKSWGIERPAMYPMGFSNANCSGDCPKGGIQHWIRVLTHFPDVFNRRAKWERDKRQDPRFAPYTILTREIQGERINLSLDDLKKEVESRDGNQMKLFDFEMHLQSSCATSECGVGWESDDE